MTAKELQDVRKALRTLLKSEGFLEEMEDANYHSATGFLRELLDEYEQKPDVSPEIIMTPERYAGLFAQAHKANPELPEITKKNFQEVLYIASMASSGHMLTPRIEGGWLLITDTEHSWEPYEMWAEIEALLPDG